MAVDDPQSVLEFLSQHEGTILAALKLYADEARSAATATLTVRLDVDSPLHVDEFPVVAGIFTEQADAADAAAAALRALSAGLGH